METRQSLTADDFRIIMSDPNHPLTKVIAQELELDLAEHEARCAAIRLRTQENLRELEEEERTLLDEKLYEAEKQRLKANNELAIYYQEQLQYTLITLQLKPTYLTVLETTKVRIVGTLLQHINTLQENQTALKQTEQKQERLVEEWQHSRKKIADNVIEKAETFTFNSTKGPITIHLPPEALELIHHQMAGRVLPHALTDQVTHLHNMMINFANEATLDFATKWDIVLGTVAPKAPPLAPNVETTVRQDSMNEIAAKIAARDKMKLHVRAHLLDRINLIAPIYSALAAMPKGTINAILEAHPGQKIYTIINDFVERHFHLPSLREIVNMDNAHIANEVVIKNLHIRCQQCSESIDKSMEELTKVNQKIATIKKDPAPKNDIMKTVRKAFHQIDAPTLFTPKTTPEL